MKSYHYDWKSWCDGRTWRLVYGLHFDSIQGLRSAAHNAGKGLGGNFHISQAVRGSNDVLHVKFIPWSEYEQKRAEQERQAKYKKYEYEQKKQAPPKPKPPISVAVNLELMNKLMKLCHPDKHPDERKALATEVTQVLMPMRDKLKGH